MEHERRDYDDLVRRVTALTDALNQKEGDVKDLLAKVTDLSVVLKKHMEDEGDELMVHGTRIDALFSELRKVNEAVQKIMVMQAEERGKASAYDRMAAALGKVMMVLLGAVSAWLAQKGINMPMPPQP